MPALRIWSTYISISFVQIHQITVHDFISYWLIGRKVFVHKFPKQRQKDLARHYNFFNETLLKCSRVPWTFLCNRHPLHASWKQYVNVIVWKNRKKVKIISNKQVYVKRFFEKFREGTFLYNIRMISFRNPKNKKSWLIFGKAKNSLFVGTVGLLVWVVLMIPKTKCICYVRLEYFDNNLFVPRRLHLGFHW